MLNNSFKGEITKKVGLNYLLHTPKKDQKEGKFPLLIFLHGAGECGVSPQDMVNLTVFHCVPDEFKDKFVFMIPICPKYSFWEPDDVIAGIKNVISKIQIVDENRIFATGYSLGGRGCWDCATAYPDFFAAIAPIAGYSCYLKAARIAQLPTWAFHGNEDETVPPIETIKMISAMKNFGGKPRATYLKGYGHAGWLGIYSSPLFYEWLLKQRKETKQKENK